MSEHEASPQPAAGTRSSAGSPVPRGAGLLRLLQLELLKLVRRRIFWLGFGLLALFGALVIVGFKHANFGGLERTIGRLARGSDYRQYINGLLSTAWSLALGYYLLIPLFVSFIFGHQLAGEAKEGTLRTILVRPVLRGHLLTAKFLASYLYILAMTFCFFGFCLCLGHLFFGKEDAGLVAFGKTFFNNEAHRPWIIERDVALRRLALGTALGGVALAPLATMAFFLSAVVENPIAAILTSFCAYMISTLLGEVQYFSAMRPYLFTTYTGFWKGVFYREIGWEEMERSAGYCGLYAVGFLLAAYLVFRFKDVKT